jgi:hypothetical protein
MTYHHPYCEQQFPYVLPRHVNPVVPAHVPSDDTIRVEVGEVLLFVDVVVLLVVVVGFVDVEEPALDELVEALTELELDEPEQVPPTGLQPVPQYADVEPQKPYWLQQFPKVEPMQVIVVPQLPSVEMAWEAEEVEDVFEEVVFDVLEVIFTVEELVLIEEEVVLIVEEVDFTEVVDFDVVEELLDVPHVPEAG